MKKTSIIICVFAMLICFANAAFTDLPESHWAFDDITKCCEEKLFFGYNDGSFKPADTITRAEAFKVLVTYRGDELEENSGAWYEPYFAAGADLWNGAPDAERAITREDAIYAIVAATSYKNEQVDLSVLEKFTDKDNISEELRDNFAIAVSNGLIYGYENNTVRPKSTLTRAEFAAIMRRAVYNEEILAERRELVYNYMLKQISMLWSPKKDILYTIKSNVHPKDAESQYLLRADRIYRGIPYAYAGSTSDAFLEYASEQNENGIYTISDLSWKALSGGNKYSTIGNDCSSAVILAWSQLGATFTGTTTTYMCEDNGFIPLVDYTTAYSRPSASYKDTRFTILQNGEDVIYAEYAKLKKADGLVRVTTSGNHAIMVGSVDVVYNKDGEIDDQKSTITFLEQTAGNFTAEKKYYDEELGKDVYYFGTIDNVYTFRKMIAAGYLPITCKPLIDSSPLTKLEITDSETEFNKDTLLTGTIVSNRCMDYVTIAIIDSDGNAIQTAAAQVRRNPGLYVNFDLQQFVTEDPALVRGNVNPNVLKHGTYHCTLTVRMTTGEEIVIRDFDFDI